VRINTTSQTVIVFMMHSPLPSLLFVGSEAWVNHDEGLQERV
jgi:hypothetical protein